MKNYSIIFLLVIALNICQAQDTIKSNIPLLIESSKIDSLISSVINVPEHLKAPKNDSCIVLSLSKNEVENFIYGAHALDHRSIIVDLGGNLKDKRSLGYFEFSGYLIFAYGDAFMSKFFTYTEAKKEFTFVKPETKNVLSLIKGYMSWAVFYREGRFYYGVH